jgi:hypothetical protein
MHHTNTLLKLRTMNFATIFVLLGAALSAAAAPAPVAEAAAAPQESGPTGQYFGRPGGKC